MTPSELLAQRERLIEREPWRRWGLASEIAKDRASAGRAAGSSDRAQQREKSSHEVKHG